LLRDWFPELPKYEAFNKGIHFLVDALKALASILLRGLGLDASHTNFVYDSMPIVVAGGARSGRAKIANEICGKSNCAAKKMW